MPFGELSLPSLLYQGGRAGQARTRGDGGRIATETKGKPMTVWRDGPGFKYLFVVTAILIIVFFLRYQQGSLDTYAYVLAGLGVVILGFLFRQRWSKSKVDYFEKIAPENELQCLEEMARDYAGRQYENREYIDKCLKRFEQAYKLPSRSVQLRLEAVRRDLEQGERLRFS